jgi:hypothetical protein
VDHNDLFLHKVPWPSSLLCLLLVAADVEEFYRQCDPGKIDSRHICLEGLFSISLLFFLVSSRV